MLKSNPAEIGIKEPSKGQLYPFLIYLRRREQKKKNQYTFFTEKADVLQFRHK